MIKISHATLYYDHHDMNTTTCLKDKTKVVYSRQSLMINSKFLLFVIASIAIITSLDTVYAQPLDDVTTTTQKSENFDTSVQLTWNHDDSVSNYEIGCVSCIPNFSVNTVNDEIILQNVTALENGLAIFYIIAHDNNDEIIMVKQILFEIH